MRKIITAGMMVLIIGLVCQLGYAEETESNKNWDFRLAPMYLWAASIDGEMTIKGVSVDVELSFRDAIKNLDGALTFHFEGVYKQRWGFFADLMYIRLNPDDEPTPLGDISIDIEETLAELGGFYRWTTGAHAIDGLGGLRYLSMRGELGLPGPLPDVDQRKDWVDPFIGVRWNWRFADRWGLRLRSDVGGFSIGSRLAWNGMGLIEFQPWKHVAFGGGYRVLYQDYDTGSGLNRFSYDATIYGPVLGLDIKW